jgi:hypothetical protein
LAVLEPNFYWSKNRMDHTVATGCRENELSPQSPVSIVIGRNQACVLKLAATASSRAKDRNPQRPMPSAPGEQRVTTTIATKPAHRAQCFAITLSSYRCPRWCQSAERCRSAFVRICHQLGKRSRRSDRTPRHRVGLEWPTPAAQFNSTRHASHFSGGSGR